MKALQVRKGEIELAELEIPRVENEALIRVLLSGICNTDLEIIRGYANFEGVIGHEFVGIVEECAARPELAGKRVVGEINAGCGECELCRSGDPRHCPRRTVLGIAGRNGSHAEYLTLPPENLTELPDSISDEQAVFTEPLAAAVGIADAVKIDQDTRVAVIGDGKLGLLCAAALRFLSPSIVIIGKHPQKLWIAADMGIRTMLLRRINSDNFRSFDVVVEASGAESGFALATELVRPRGTIVLKSTFHGSPSWDASRIVVDEITIVGSRCGRFRPALGLLESRSVDVERLISRVMPLSKGVEAMQIAARPGILKVLLRPDT
jgi:threonine dehydrogenase-like Zn-dependent dehydrogenase